MIIKKKKRRRRTHNGLFRRPKIQDQQKWYELRGSVWLWWVLKAHAVLDSISHGTLHRFTAIQLPAVHSPRNIRFASHLTKGRWVLASALQPSVVHRVTTTRFMCGL